MTKPPPVRLSGLVPTVLLTSAPAAAVLFTLALLGLLNGWAALAGAVAAAALGAVLLRPHLRDLLAVAAHLRGLASGSRDEPPEVGPSAIAEELLIGIAQLRRSWRQKNAELEAVASSNETAIDSLPDPLFFLDAQRRVVRTNLAGRKLFGRELVGRELASSLRDPGILDATERVLAGRPGEELELVLSGAMDRVFRATVTPLPIRGVDGSVAVLALHDMTALKRIERMRADFVANASHELRTPLAALLGFIETLRGPARDDAEARERFLAIMQEQAGRMSRLVNDLLSLSRIELNEHSAPQDHVALSGVLRHVVDGLALQAQARDNRLEVDLPDDLPPVVGQPDELTQVFQNLIDNALKYGGEQRPVEISARRVDRVPTAAGQALPGGAVAVAVRDHGEGIAREHLPRLTERFYRVDTARSRTLGGTGLGLAIVKHIVNRHRGALTIDSTPGEGSIFTVYLPVAGDGDV